jgi:hypothetical protein
LVLVSGVPPIRAKKARYYDDIRLTERVLPPPQLGRLALFVRFWLTVTPPLPDTAQPAAQARGRERYDGFVEALGRRLAKGQTLAQEISQDFLPKDGKPDRTDGSS